MTAVIPGPVDCRPLPIDDDAEKLVVGAMLLGRECLDQVRAALAPDDLAVPELLELHATISRLADRGVDVDLVALKTELAATGRLEAVGGLDFIIEVAELGRLAAYNIGHYAGLVADRALRRRCIGLARRLSDGAYGSQVDTAALLAELRHELDGLTELHPGTHSIRPAPVLVSLADVQPRPVRWLWPNRIALGKLTVLAGNPDLGKSFVTLDLAARVSRGDGWPDCPGSTAEPGGVVLLSAEDDLEDTIRPRLDAAGANVSRIFAFTTTKQFDPGKGREVLRPFNLGADLWALEEAIQKTQNCRLVVIDPVSCFMSGTDSHNNCEVRAVLTPLADLASRYRVAVVVVSHLNKGNGDALSRVTGSLAFVAAARAAFLVVRDKDDRLRRLCLPAKNNLSGDDTGMAYRLSGYPMPHVEWEPLPVRVSADEAIAPDDHRPGPPPEDREECQAWLRDYLRSGPQPADTVFSAAAAVGFTRATLRRAKSAAGVLAEKQSFDGPWIWKVSA